MKQYGIKVTQGQDTLEVYFRPLSYLDWTIYSSSKEMFDPSSVRYVLGNYVTRVIENGEDIDPILILDKDAVILQKTVNAIFEKSVFNDEEGFLNIMKDLEDRSKTLMGCYDFFVFIKMGPEFYIQMLEQDAYTRAQIIMMIEKSSQVDVKERFEFAVHNNIPLDLISDDSTYKKNLRKHGKPMPQNPKAPHSPLERHKQAMADVGPAKKEDMPSNVDGMLDESRNALQQALNAGRNKQRKTFDWRQDEDSFNQINSE